VFPARYELNSYIVFRKRLVSKRLTQLNTIEAEGVSRIWTIKYGLEFRGTALARTGSNSKLQTRPLVREGVTK
jgi:hypothetical protein